LKIDFEKITDIEGLGNRVYEKIVDKDVKQVIINIPIINEMVAPVGIRIYGDSSDEVESVTRDLTEFLNDVDGTYNVSNNISEKRTSYRITIDEDELINYGLTPLQIQLAIRQAVTGYDDISFLNGDERMNVKLSVSIEQVENIRNIQILSPVMNMPITLDTFVEIEEDVAFESVYRIDQKFAYDVEGYLEQGVASGDVLAQIDEYIEDEDFSNVEFSFGGERESITKYFGGVLTASIYAIIIIYFIMAIQFKSLSQPFVILFTVPLSLIGSALFLIIFDQPLSFSAALGAASLIGIVVNNGILLIEYINREIKDGALKMDASIKSLDSRFRPIMLSSITTIFGLIPLVISNDSFFKPLAFTLMGGLLTSTLLTLIMIPTVYNLFSTKK
jgi:multidrug efflux pump subunit AcrB